MRYIFPCFLIFLLIFAPQEILNALDQVWTEGIPRRLRLACLAGFVAILGVIGSLFNRKKGSS